MKQFTILTSALLILFAISCSDDEEIICNDIFQMVTVQVIGDTLTDSYTVRNSNEDTLRYQLGDIPGPDLHYTVITDSYHEQIKNSIEEFTFYGFINDSLVIEELYRIRANDCHVFLEEGPTEIQL